MRPLRMVAISTVAFLVMAATPALAACAFGCGGGFDAFSYRAEYLWPGQTVTWSTDVYMDTKAASPDDGPFFAYLIDPGWSRTPRTEDGVQLAPVETEKAGRFSYEVSVTFTVPATTSLGSYALEVCDDPCTKRLGYLGPTRVEIVSGDIEARLTERIDRLALKVEELPVSMRAQARRLAKRSSEMLRTEMTVAEEKLDMQATQLELRVTELEKRLASQEEPAKRGDVSQSALAGGIVVLVLGAWFVRERRHNSL